ncbi:MAG: hypothetical protein ACREEC_12115 [Thermoplasmata archaeon]
MLSVRDSWTHDIYTLAGKRTVTEVTLWCKFHRKRVFPPPPLTPPKSPFAFDVVAEAGRLRFLEDRKLASIVESLHGRGLPRLPLRTVQRLTDRFLLYHMAVHLESFSRLREELRQRGGYVLVLDSTGIAGRMTLVLTDDDESGGTGWTLLAAPTEKESPDEVRPFLKLLKDALGPPLAGISDQSDGLRDPFREIFPGVYLLLCQFHVLRSIGEALAGKLYGRFKREADKCGVKGALRRLARRLGKKGGASREARETRAWIEEILAWEKAAQGRTFPFFWEALEFYRRCRKVEGELDAALSRPGRRAKGAPYLELKKVLARLLPPPKPRTRLARDFPLLEEKWGWYERIRRAVGFRNGPVPLSPKGTLSDRGLERGRRRLDWLLGKMEEERSEKSHSPRIREFHAQLGKIAEKLRAHREELFAPNVRVKVGGRWKVRRIHRSNGAAERKFHRLRGHGRSIAATKDVEDLIQREGPGTLVAQNLKDAHYPIFRAT